MRIPSGADVSFDEKPCEEWMYPYVGGAFDFSRGLRFTPVKSQSSKIGYYINSEIIFTSTKKVGIGVIDQFCEEYGVRTNFKVKEKAKGDTYELAIAKRKDIEEFLSVIHPFVVDDAEQVQIALEHILPGLERGDHQEKQSFVNLMYYIEKFRENEVPRRKVKYTRDYFVDEWDM